MISYHKDCGNDDKNETQKTEYKRVVFCFGDQQQSIGDIVLTVGFKIVLFSDLQRNFTIVTQRLMT